MGCGGRLLYDACPHGIGRVCQIDDESGSLQYEYDAFGNITSTRRTEQGVEYVTAYEYDGDNRVTALVYPSGRRIKYQRDSLGRVVAVHADVAGQTQPILSDIRYRADGKLVSARFGNGLTQTRGYDLQGRLVEQALFDDGGTIIDQRSYAYDPAGNLIARTGTPGDQRYAYDSLDRLIGQDIAAEGKAWQYDYDSNHNRQHRSDGVGLNEIYSYQSQTNRLTEIDKQIDTPVADQPPSKHFSYNQAGRFAEYLESGVVRATYIYDALGQRTRKTLPGETRTFHYGTNNQLLSEGNVAGTPIKDYLWLGSEPIAQIESTGVVVYLHTDHSFTPRLGTSDAGAVVWQWEGQAFGDAQAQGAIEVNLRFPGQYFDKETGRHYNYYRDYEPGTGRYIESDPIGLKGGINPYGYVGGNPISRIDPLGLRDVIVAIWLQRPFAGQVGHVFLGETDGRVLLSQFPIPHGRHGANMTFNWDATQQSEGRPPDAVYKVFVKNDEAFDAAVQNARDRPYWDFLPGGSEETHCAYAADNALEVGGVPGVLGRAILPADINGALRWHNFWGSDSITPLPGVPW